MRKPYFFLPLILLILLSGCRNDSSIRQPVPFYYLNQTVTYGTEWGLIGFEEREGRNRSSEELVSDYLKGPSSDKLENPFPKGTRLISMTVESNTVTLVLSDKYAALTGIELTAANACLAKTVFELTQTQSITIHCKSKLLDGQESILITRDSYLLLDLPTNAPPTEDETITPNIERN